jgi:hypothetical protein
MQVAEQKTAVAATLTKQCAYCLAKPEGDALAEGRDLPAGFFCSMDCARLFKGRWPERWKKAGEWYNRAKFCGFNPGL